MNPLDIVGGLLFAIDAFFLIALGVSAVLGYLLFRYLRNMTAFNRMLVVSGLIFLGIVLIATAVGSGVGSIALLTGIFTQFYSFFRKGNDDAE